MKSRTEAAGERRIVRAAWGRAGAALTRPYDLSFTSLSVFETVWVRMEDNEGRVGLGEAVALPGYAWETAEDIAAAVSGLIEDAAGRPVARQEDRCRAIRRDHPFAASAVLSALELPGLLAGHRADFSFPLNVPVSGETPLDPLHRQVCRSLDDGYAFIKVKIGRDIEAESAAARLLLDGPFEQPFKVVFDANQAFSVEQALGFASLLAALPQDRLLWLEQPVDREDWNAMAEVCHRAKVPVVLDEAIYDDGDVERAAAIGAHGVKLKLCKNFGPRGTLELAGRAKDLGLAVVFGNGVATDIGNLAEILVLEAGAGLFSPPCECSGFAKLARPLLPGVIDVASDGRVRIPLPSAALHKVIEDYAG